MSYNSVLIDSLVRIKNAQSAMLRKVELRFSGLLVSSLAVLKDLGYIDSYEIQPDVSINVLVNKVVVSLKYYGLMPVIRDIKIFSKPGSRVFVSSDKIPKFYSGMGEVILTTNKGVMSGKKARKLGLGGELLCGVF